MTEAGERTRSDLAALFAGPLAHRGLHRPPEVPENSLGAVAAAIEAGFGIEFDVRSLADGTVVVFHDDGLLRMTGQAGALPAARWDQIAPLRLLGSNWGIPRFAELLELVAGRIPLYVEVKNDGAAGALEEGVATLLDPYRGPFAVASFNPSSLAWFVANRPGFTRGQIAGKARGPAELAAMAAVSHPHFLAYELAGYGPELRRFVAERLGLPVMLWTARSEADIRFCHGMGANPVFERVAPPRHISFTVGANAPMK